MHPPPPGRFSGRGSTLTPHLGAADRASLPAHVPSRCPRLQGMLVAAACSVIPASGAILDRWRVAATVTAAASSTSDLPPGLRAVPPARTRQDGAKMVDFLRERDIAGATVLEIGGGVGEIGIELVRAGAERAENLELSPAYETEARKLAEEKGVAELVACAIHDIAENPETVEPADIVVMHRVVCCYPDYERLLRITARRARHTLVFSYPRRNVSSRSFVGAANLLQRLKGSTFRGFAPPPAAMLKALERQELHLAYEHHAPDLADCRTPARDGTDALGSRTWRLIGLRQWLLISKLRSRRRPLVWKVLTDVERWPAWNPDMQSSSSRETSLRGAGSGGKQGRLPSARRSERVDQPRVVGWTGKTRRPGGSRMEA